MKSITDKICGYMDCQNKINCKGLCGTHYSRLRLTGSLERTPTPEKPVCSYDECTTVSRSSGLCNTHYERLRITGSVHLLSRPPCSKDGCNTERSRFTTQARGLCTPHYKEWRGEHVFCSVEGCSRPERSLKLCDMHYNRHLRIGSPGEAEQRKVFKHTEKCSAEGCERGRVSFEFCSRHYTKNRRNSMTVEERRILSAPPHTRRRRALKLNAPTERYTAIDIVKLYGSVCHICNEDIDLSAPRHPANGVSWERGLQLDHVIPLSKGGTDLINNIRPAHVLCNMRKHARLEYVFPLNEGGNSA